MAPARARCGISRAGVGSVLLYELPPHVVVSLAGFVIGVAFGAVAQRSNFCAMGAVTDIAITGDWRRMRAWLLAAGVAMLGIQSLAAAGLIQLEDSIYLDSRLAWVGAVVGGLLFGAGMVFAGGCGSRNLVRLGAGDLRAFVVVLVLAVSAGMALRGLTAWPRVGLTGALAIDLAGLGVESQGLGDLLAALFGGGPAAWAPAAGWALGLAILAFCLSNHAFRRSARNLVSGVLIGLLVVAGWLATGVLGSDEFEPVPLASLTFVAPVGDSLLYLMTFTGSRLGFGVAVVGGVVVGAFAAALQSGAFRVQGFADRGDFLRNVLGAFLMGFGGVCALGCTIGQGITGLSTLAVGSFLAAGSIVLGGVLGLRLLERMEG